MSPPAKQLNIVDVSSVQDIGEFVHVNMLIFIADSWKAEVRSSSDGGERLLLCQGNGVGVLLRVKESIGLH